MLLDACICTTPSAEDVLQSLYEMRDMPTTASGVLFDFCSMIPARTGSDGLLLALGGLSLCLVGLRVRSLVSNNKRAA